ncbi:SDR family NAD(P)-dependent oxidoreductase [Cupriavidus sp. AU9028]|uniref:SDR family NAD(P)-dependent oxidoreductase n=1 Tax=Cupriavidus sp. AU9028 TaxID=2871157 RepID=UPI001C972E0B|nr:SDR family oxidoreductase [Cupriavidus sp. AU9028]MBY4895538.1 SDR family oxidoreductase [Cupriavidus sp. AU9028]
MATVLITGAAAGIGRAAAHRLARDGWRCLLVDRDAARLDAALRSLPAGMHGDHLALQADLADAAAIEAVARRVRASGPLDALVSNAGISDNSNRGIEQQDAARWRTVLDVNLHAPARLVEALSPVLNPGARVVNVASGAGLRAIPWRGAYSASKAGLIAMSRALARQRRDLCVTALCPGFVRTELVDGLIASGQLDPARAVAKIPLGRMAEPADIAETIRFLCEADAAPLSGLVLSVDGGSSVFGGSQAFAPAVGEPVALDAAAHLRVEGAAGAHAPGLADVAPSGEGHGGEAQGGGQGYCGVIDLTPAHASPGARLEAVRASACRFAGQHPHDASLTLLLPREDRDDWRAAADAAAARMLVATLACEWGQRALRINAVQCEVTASPASSLRYLPLLRYLAAPAARCITGQVLTMPS